MPRTSDNHSYVARKQLWRERDRRALARAHARRLALIERLGGRCAVCGSTDALQLDHYPAPATWDQRAVGMIHRIRIYEREAARGLLRVLCANCNASEGAARGAYQNAKRLQQAPLCAGGARQEEYDLRCARFLSESYMYPPPLSEESRKKGKRERPGPFGWPG